MEMVQQFFKDITNIARTRKFWTTIAGFVVAYIVQEAADAEWV